MELQRVRRLQQQVDAADDGRLALSGPDGVQRLCQREQAAGTGRVQRVTGPVEVERVRYPVGEHGPAAARQPVTVYAVLGSVPIVVRLRVERADKHAGLGPAYVIRVHACKTNFESKLFLFFFFF